MAAYVYKPTTPQTDLYCISTSKQVLVTKDPIFVRKDVVNGRYIGRKPDNYMLVAMILCVFNPLFGPVALFFASKLKKEYLAEMVEVSASFSTTHRNQQTTAIACKLIMNITDIQYL